VAGLRNSFGTTVTSENLIHKELEEQIELR
jgi:hypothetical protein